MIEALAIILALALAYAVNRTKHRPTREQLRREYEAAQRDHKARRDIHRLYVQATCRELRR